MTGNAGNRSLRERMERARGFFSKRAAAPVGDDAELYAELCNLTEAVEEMASLLDYQKVQLEEVRHGLGHHLEETGLVPHTRRSR